MLRKFILCGRCGRSAILDRFCLKRLPVITIYKGYCKFGRTIHRNHIRITIDIPVLTPSGENKFRIITGWSIFRQHSVLSRNHLLFIKQHHLALIHIRPFRHIINVHRKLLLHFIITGNDIIVIHCIIVRI